MFASTRERVPAHTSDEINRRIKAETEERVRYYSKNQDEIDERLDALDREWDIERAIEANAAAVSLLGLVLGTTRDRRWLAVPGLVATFLFQHAIQGWCPPVPVLRRLGFRTVFEIDQERMALKALRGDFNKVADAKNKARAASRAAELLP